MSIKRAFYSTFTVIGLILISMFLVMHMISEAQYIKAVTVQRRYESYKLADQLRQSSDDLTRMIRTYSVTANPVYKDRFYTILDIRNGTHPRPKQYDHAYWDLILDGKPKPSPDSQPKAISELMKDMQFSDKELAKLTDAQRSSDKLVQLEEAAMHAMAGEFADESGDYTVNLKPNQEMARRLVHGKEYHQAKFQIMTQINEFFVMLESRTTSEVQAAEEREKFWLNVAWGLVLLAGLTCALAIIYLSKGVLTPVNKLLTHTRELGQGHYQQHITLHGCDELKELSEAFNTMSQAISADIQARINTEQDLVSAKVEVETAYHLIKSDLDAAAEVQQSLLPETMPASDKVEFSYAYHPCDQLAGDTLNVVDLDEKHIALYLLDVSGHGVQAALLASTLSHILNPAKSQYSVLWTETAYSHRLATPQEVAQRLNERFPMNPEACQYFTIHYGVLNLETYCYRFISAGHPGPILVADGNGPEIIHSTGPGIGILENPVFQELAIDLSQGDRIFFLSDGVLEAENKDNVQFQDSALTSNIAAISQYPLKQGVQILISSISDWTEDSQIDDISVLALEIK